MPLKLQEALELLMEKIPKEVLETPKLFSKDIEEINLKIYKAFRDINSIFQGKMNLIGSGINDPNLPHVLHLKMPFKITPIKTDQVEDVSVYNLKTDVRHPAVRSGYVIPGLIAFLFGVDLQRALASIGQVICESGKTYTLSVVMPEKNIDGGQIFEIKNSGTKDEDPLYKFHLCYNFANDSKTYLDNGSQLWLLNLNAQNDIRTALTLLVHLNGNILDVYDAVFVTKAKNAYNLQSGAVEMTLEALKHLISVSDNPGRLSFVYNKLMDFKQSDSVDLAELMALFGLH